VLNRLSYRPPASLPKDDDENLRHRCRNCRSKLSAPVNNAREAFCCRGCHVGFYRTRCRVCEGPIEQPAHGTRLICKKAKCRSACREGLGLGRYHGLISAESPQEVPENKGLKRAISSDQASSWRVVAGPELSPSQFHCASVSDGPGSRWKNGEYRRLEAKNQAALTAAEQKQVEADGGYFTDADWREVVSPDGVVVFVSRWRAAS
jgi:hypothetical protein